MNQLLFLSGAALVGTFGGLNPAFAGSFAPAAGQTGSTAIHKDDVAFVGWATGATVVRGLADIANPGGANASFGTDSEAIGKAEGTSLDVVSLGDGGSAILTFDTAIANGDGADFAVFENSFSDVFLELAFVEVSSDGINFFRFDAVSETQTTTQVGGFGTLDPTNLDNLAGKYRQGYGTPFDLEELVGTIGLDVNNITHVRVVDVVGSINPLHATTDSLGNVINDPYATPFSSSGFDLDAVGVINVVPEPGAMLIATLGLFGLAVRGRQRTI
ncbi:PEP-CTERM sorting domain-containing protein [Poriferisphaera sp. WC338]|uniref:PEP-CTERM sorting domain-containing protein n=1 Tax=Poriferisphaera sp. WC338 TaxID=3425129 RepID=UPI003D817622